MDFLLGAVVIIILLFILGIGFDVISFGIAIVLMLMTAATELFFLYYFIRLLLSKRREGEFVRIDRPEGGKFDRAYYLISEGELPNVFPCEFVMRDKLYKKGKRVKLRIDAGKKRVFDRNAFTTIVLGTLLGLLGFMFVLGVFLYIRVF